MSPASQAAIEQRHTRLNPGFKPTAADALLQNIADKKRRLADLGSSLSSGLFTSSSSDAMESPTKMRRETSNVLGEVASRVKGGVGIAGEKLRRAAEAAEAAKAAAAEAAKAKSQELVGGAAALRDTTVKRASSVRDAAAKAINVVDEEADELFDRVEGSVVAGVSGARESVVGAVGGAYGWAKTGAQRCAPRW